MIRGTGPGAPPGWAGTLTAAAIPVLLGVGLIRLFPGIGAAHGGFGDAAYLTLFWLCANLYLVLAPVPAWGPPRRAPSRMRRALWTVACAIALGAALRILFFERLAGAVPAALVSIALYYALAPVLLPGPSPDTSAPDAR